MDEAYFKLVFKRLMFASVVDRVRGGSGAGCVLPDVRGGGLGTQGRLRDLLPWCCVLSDRLGDLPHPYLPLGARLQAVRQVSRPEFITGKKS